MPSGTATAARTVVRDRPAPATPAAGRPASAAVAVIAVSAAHRARAGEVLWDLRPFVVPAFPSMALLRDAASMPREPVSQALPLMRQRTENVSITADLAESRALRRTVQRRPPARQRPRHAQRSQAAAGLAVIRSGRDWLRSRRAAT